jgi:ABC-type uncharacterized transport system permease subunit
VPVWLWAILAYFMHDNVLSWIQNPFVLLLTVAAAGGIGYLVATGRWQNVVSTIMTLMIPIRMLLESKGLLPKTAQPPNASAPKTELTKSD